MWQFAKEHKIGGNKIEEKPQKEEEKDEGGEDESNSYGDEDEEEGSTDMLYIAKLLFKENDPEHIYINTSDESYYTPNFKFYKVKFNSKPESFFTDSTFMWDYTIEESCYGLEFC
jgi:hypothetical protein